MISLATLRHVMEGAIPATIATCAPDGTPNVSFVSQVHYVDEEHVALSFQFFSKTRENVLANPRASVLALHPETGGVYRFELAYLRTETDGPLFESMKAKLAGIASHTGMSGVFRLLGADVYRVCDVERVPGREVAPPARPDLLPAVRRVVDRILPCTDLGALLDGFLSALEAELHVHHAMVLLADADGRQLYTVATRGYAHSGIGSEIAFGHGVIGAAAQARTPIRLMHAATEYSYGRTVRERAEARGMTDALSEEIPFPGLARSGSQLAVPIVAGTRLVGVLYVESSEERRFRYDDEDALVILADHLGLAVRLLQQGAERDDDSPAQALRMPQPAGAPLAIRHYPEQHSVFVDDDYLIKGVAGAILWKLLGAYAREGRTEFTNRELRLDPAIGLPELSENLEARLILLQRRLAERCAFLRLEKTGRGRLRLVVARPLRLLEST
jgi:adenylate cyclase